MGDYRKALPLHEQARDICKAALGERHPTYALSLNNLALVHESMGDYTKALPLLQQARDIRKAALGERHPDYAASLNNLALLHYHQGQARKAESLAYQSLVCRQDHLETTFFALSDRQRLDLLAQQRFGLNNYLSVVLAAKTPVARLYRQVLAWKGLVASRHTEERLALDQPALAPLLSELRFARAGLARLAANPPSVSGQKQWRQRFDELERQKEAIEVKLADASKDFQRLREHRHVNAEQVRAALPAGTVLLDLLRYTHLEPDPKRRGWWLEEDRLLAFVVAKGREPICVPLGPEAPIARLIAAWRAPLAADPPASPSESVARELRRLLWLPLEKHLPPGCAVLVAPDGALCGLPFAALPGARPGSFLVEERAFAQVTSGRHLLELAGDDRRVAAGLFNVGGLDYGHATSRAVVPEIRQRFAPWSALPGSELERERVERLFRACFPNAPKTHSLTGINADSAAFQKALATDKVGSHWRHLHLATHGYFEPLHSVVRQEALAVLAIGVAAASSLAGPMQALSVTLAADEPGVLDRTTHTLDLSGQRQRTFQRNPQLLCGLVLSGANRSPERGLLSAEEIGRLDLRGCELVVLSACDTGLGKVAGGEGVLGLQRAFQSAGARATITSLWSVPDAATSVLMEQLYLNLWRKKMSRLEALRQAQLTVLRNPALVEARQREIMAQWRKRHPEQATPGFRKPGRTVEALPQGDGKARRSPIVSWASFVLCGDSR
jgi:CHAT domain-containing protein